MESLVVIFCIYAKTLPNRRGNQTGLRATQQRPQAFRWVQSGGEGVAVTPTVEVGSLLDSG